ncbi:MAG: hypothetical protein L0211_17650 [Planctomycetaceae bacterium]|nr:hypothetical protein [Planctomycetaceae bacterium]
MRIDGEWLHCLDGGIRPVVRGELLGGDGQWHELELLIDTGADRTVLSSEILKVGQLIPVESDRHIGGLGGLVESVAVESQLRMIRDDAQQVVFRGRFVACTQIEALDMSILGRDILDMFALVIDRPSNVVAILGGQHRYSIHGPT